MAAGGGGRGGGWSSGWRRRVEQRVERRGLVPSSREHSSAVNRKRNQAFFLRRCDPWPPCVCLRWGPCFDPPPRHRSGYSGAARGPVAEPRTSTSHLTATTFTSLPGAPSHPDAPQTNSLILQAVRSLTVTLLLIGRLFLPDRSTKTSGKSVPFI